MTKSKDQKTNISLSIIEKKTKVLNTQNTKQIKGGAIGNEDLDGL